MIKETDMEFMIHPLQNLSIVVSFRTLIALLVIFLLSLANVCAQQDSLVKLFYDEKSNNWPITNPSEENLIILPVAKKGSSIDLSLIKNTFGNSSGIIFAYPDNAFRDTNEQQLKKLSREHRIMNTKIIGVPTEPNKNDRDNIKLANLELKQVVCVVYTQDSILLQRAANKSEYFTVTSEGLPVNFYQIQLLNEELCIATNRILFHDQVLFEFLDPVFSNDEKIDKLTSEVESLKKEILELKKSLLNQKKQLSDLKKTSTHEEDASKNTRKKSKK